MLKCVLVKISVYYNAYFSQKICFDISCRQFAKNVKVYFLGNIRKISSILLPAEFAQSVIHVQVNISFIY